jgi:hypothetical protein
MLLDQGYDGLSDQGYRVMHLQLVWQSDLFNECKVLKIFPEDKPVQKKGWTARNVSVLLEDELQSVEQMHSSSSVPLCTLR